MCVCVCVCVCEREREFHRQREGYRRVGDRQTDKKESFPDTQRGTEEETDRVSQTDTGGQKRMRQTEIAKYGLQRADTKLTECKVRPTDPSRGEFTN